MAKLSIRKIPCGVYQANAWLVWREDRTDSLLIDCGDDPNRCLAALSESGRSLSDIVCTHGHFDHILGISTLQKATCARVAITQADAPMLSDPTLSMVTEETGLSRFTPCQPDLFLDTLPGGIYMAAGIPFRVLKTPGHTPGSCCLYLPEQNLLFSGDTLFAYGFGRTDFPGGSLTSLKASLQSLFTLPGETAILPGHGDAGRMQTYHAHLRRSEP